MELFVASRTAIEHAAPVAFLLAFVFGMLSSVGPCMTTRLVVISGASRRSAVLPALLALAFLVGLSAVYVGFAFAIRFLGVVQIVQSQIAVLATAAFVGAGIFALYSILRPPAHNHACDPKSNRSTVFGMAGVGALSALNFSPCCAPWLIMALTYTNMQGNALYGAVLMVVFSIGHAVPMLVFGRVLHDLTGWLERRSLGTYIAPVNCALLFFLALYYGVQI